MKRNFKKRNNVSFDLYENSSRKKRNKYIAFETESASTFSLESELVALLLSK